jgi:hypothetical protein
MGVMQTVWLAHPEIPMSQCNDFTIDVMFVTFEGWKNGVNERIDLLPPQSN